MELINTGYSRMPQMPCLSEIETNGSYPGVVILNNKRLRDIRGFINWDRHFRIQGYTQFPVFISGNEQLDTVNMPSIIHHQFSPISCEKRLTPNYSIQYAEGLFQKFLIFLFYDFSHVPLIRPHFSHHLCYSIPLSIEFGQCKHLFRSRIS